MTPVCIDQYEQAKAAFGKAAYMDITDEFCRTILLNHPEFDEAELRGAIDVVVRVIIGASFRSVQVSFNRANRTAMFSAEGSSVLTRMEWRAIRTIFRGKAICYAPGETMEVGGKPHTCTFHIMQFPQTGIN